ncbi:MAG: TlyA family rRNA (cytidine-2'-O)-methyltransferase [Candidatus Thermofonsia Clade 1 bacterium]|uniref:TlyA family rRNA (Cytidine-2'-O)-methyltransferase n=1 Tax=Candidatus Thermofonsia Clade 1 bacterium TaxID=2364210 RepID=A0A2M8PY97_9CHLR|nr:MAG: TlyA family rRNA (cytidine-2'-O)-methyltransferase [Candidatus Thermofonsia Clade 1 bacterium]PJF42517.1 MAG: TlyA family rRNA (cytidine-2'-O)-methyltransferase [Candidatus Thermofonsia Clade 1 bacterium]RMF49560.1 MAG: TlyA family RNA methyltransferase [Chloroflexota bacterium]
MVQRERLDILLVARGKVESREQARRLIMAGEVRVNGQLVDKPGQRVPSDAELQVQRAPRYVSRGGEKLAAALHTFEVPVAGQICADIGASHGGFTDCLLQHGAAKVYALDVGYGQLDYRLRLDERVVVMERTNVRYVPSLPEPIGVAVIDVSFISLRLVLPVVRGWLGTDAHVVALIKPQFEAGRREVGKGGIVKAPEVHRRVLAAVLNAARAENLMPCGLIRSPLRGASGNVEFLAWLRHAAPALPMFDQDAAIDSALSALDQAQEESDV